MQRTLKCGPVLGLVLALGGISSLSAATIFDRGLPDSTNVNDVAGANRSNVTWDFGSASGVLVGDDFMFSNAGIVDSITVFEVANGTGAGSTPGSEFNSFTLYYGGVNLLDHSSSVFTSQLVTYQPGGENYQGSGGGFYDIYALTFNGLNFSADANTLYGFALAADPKTGNTLALHASNAALSGTPQQGADNLFSGYDATTLAYLGSCDSGDSTTCGPLWDKSSDINVKIDGTLVPEPASLGLMAIGIGALIFVARKRRTNLA